MKTLRERILDYIKRKHNELGHFPEQYCIRDCFGISERKLRAEIDKLIKEGKLIRGQMDALYLPSSRESYRLAHEAFNLCVS